MNRVSLINGGFNYLDNLKWRFFKTITTCVMNLKLRAIGVKLGKDCSFFGLPKIKKSNKSSMSIGAACVFRSSSTSNLIGINRPCIITCNTSDSVLEIGKNCGFSGTVIGCFDSIIIEDNVKCGANTLITDSDWHPEDARAGLNKTIVIKNNVWLGVNVTVLKGVTIGENSLIGAGSVVVADIPANVIAAGVPCKVLKKIEQ